MCWNCQLSTCEDGFVSLELSISDDERHVAEGGSFKQQTKLITEPTSGHLDRCDAGLTGHVHRLTHHAHLYTVSGTL